MTLQFRMYDDHGWGPWLDVVPPYSVGYNDRKWSNFELREKPEFVPGWFQDYSMEYAWEDRGEQGPIRWFDWNHNFSGNKWRRVEVKILDDPNEG